MMRADIGPGVTLPDFELPDHTGRLRRLSEIQGDDRIGHRPRSRGLLGPQVRAAWERGEIDRIYPPELGWPDRASGPPPTRPA
jgi:hypothetical protein